MERGLHDPLSLTNFQLNNELIDKLIIDVISLPPNMVAPFSTRSPLPPLPIDILGESNSKLGQGMSGATQPSDQWSSDVRSRHPAAMLAAPAVGRMPAFLDPVCLPHIRVDPKHRIVVTAKLNQTHTGMEMTFHFGLNVKILVPVDSWRRQTLRPNDVRRAVVSALRQGAERDTGLVVARPMTANGPEPELSDMEVFPMDL